MEIGNIIPHIEALIFASDKPLTSMEITELINNAFGFMEEKLTLEQIQTSIDGIIEKYASEFYPFEIRESGGGWQFLTKKDFHKTVAQLNGEKFLKRLSSAALETLAIIAYKQPITKGEIEAIRGVSSDYSIQKLLEKELILISGRNEEMPGKPLVYATSKSFMDYFGINSAADLPKLKEVFAETLIEPTVITHAPGEVVEEESVLIVSENGELILDAQETGTNEEIGTEEQLTEENRTEETGTDEERTATGEYFGIEEGSDAPGQEEGEIQSDEEKEIDAEEQAYDDDEAEADDEAGDTDDSDDEAAEDPNANDEAGDLSDDGNPDDDSDNHPPHPGKS